MGLVINVSQEKWKIKKGWSYLQVVLFALIRNTEREQVWVNFTFVRIELEVLVGHPKGGVKQAGLELKKHIWVQFLNLSLIGAYMILEIMDIFQILKIVQSQKRAGLKQSPKQLQVLRVQYKRKLIKEPQKEITKEWEKTQWENLGCYVQKYFVKQISK